MRGEPESRFEFNPCSDLCDLKNTVPLGTGSVKARTSWEGPAYFSESRGESTNHVKLFVEFG